MAQAVSEAVATVGLMAVIAGCARQRPSATPVAVGAYRRVHQAAYWFTSSTSFANPAVTFARAFTDTFSGIRLADVPMFVAAQAVGAAVATVFMGWLVPAPPQAVKRAAAVHGRLEVS
jgi:glycerol uptake facilitator-like aquaporin